MVRGASELEVFGAGDRGSERSPVARGHEDVFGAVQHERRCRDGAERCDGGGALDGVVEREREPQALGDILADAIGSCSSRRQGVGVGDRGPHTLGRRHVHAALEEPERRSVGLSAGGRRRQHEAADAVRVAGGDMLGDDAPEGHAVDVRTPDSRDIEHGDRLVGELGGFADDVQRQHTVALAEHRQGPQPCCRRLAGPGDQQDGGHQKTGISR
jgi:hypothetical protein